MAGVKIPKFERLTLGTDTKMNLTGLGAGGQQIQQTRKVAPLTSSFCKLISCNHPGLFIMYITLSYWLPCLPLKTRIYM